MYMGRSVINIISNATQCTVYFSCFHVLLDFISYFNLVDYTCSLYFMCGTRCQFMCSTLCYVMLFTLESYQHEGLVEEHTLESIWSKEPEAHLAKYSDYPMSLGK
jgi:hypothetical protein